MLFKKKLNGGKSGKLVYKRFNKLYKQKDNSNSSSDKILQFLETKNIDFVPKYLGENKNYYIYSYLKGKTKPIVSMEYNQICKIIDMIKKIQTVSFDYTKNDQVICHGDLSQMNVVFDRNDLPKYIIDWDGAYLGSPLDDICYILILWVNIGSLSDDNNMLIDKLSKVIKYCDFDNQTKLSLKEKMINRAIYSLKNIKDKQIYSKTKEWVDYVINWLNINWNKIDIN